VRTDGRTDGHDEATVAFRNFANAPKSEKVTLKTSIKRSMGWEKNTFKLTADV